MAPLIWSVVIALAAAAAWWWFRRARSPALRARNLVAKFAASHGAARCQEALLILDQLKRQPERIPEIWPLIAKPLLEAAPDCPPDLKPALLASLDRIAEGCPIRDLAKGIMAARNQILAGA